MAEQAYARRGTSESETYGEDDPVVPVSRATEPSTTKPTSEIVDDIDELLKETAEQQKDVRDILDEIEASGILEVDPARVVKSYVQRGGQ
jgi:ubiquitin-like protein Pup